MKSTPNLLMELNSPQIWDWQWIINCVDYAKKFGYTGLILHQQELLSILSSPLTNPSHLTTQNENLIHQRNFAFQYLKKVSNLFYKNNLTFWLEGEACPNDDLISRKFPEYNLEQRNKGEFWTHFYQSIIESLLKTSPYFNGLILSITIPDFEPEGIINAFKYLSNIMHKNTKTLILRDYIDLDWPRRQLISVLSKLPSNIRASIKATELDFHPSFSNHPHIAQLPNNKKWIEYDLWGSGYGWSYVPCYLIDEIKNRLQWAMGQDGEGVEAIVTRICWQWLPGRTTFDSVNLFNVLGMSHITLAEENSVLEDKWLDYTGLSFHTLSDRNIYFSSIYNSYQWLIATPNILGRRLHYQSQIPENLEHALQLLHLDTRSANWTQSYQPLLPTDDITIGTEQRNLIQLEKEKAMFISSGELLKLKAMLTSVKDPSGIIQKNIDSWRISEIYLEMFQLVALSTCDAMWNEHYPNNPLPKNTITNHQHSFYELSNKIEHFLNEWEHPVYTSLPLLLNTDRLIQFSTSLPLT